MSHFKNVPAVSALAIAIVTLLAPFALAGGKAEPGRIVFKRGTSSASVRGAVKGDEAAEYTFGARASQRLTLTLSSTPAASVRVALQGPSGVAVPLQSPRPSTWTSALSEDGDYILVCSLARASQSVSHYTLTVAIE